MSYTPIVVEIIATFCLVAFILYQYGDLKKQNAIVTFAVLIAWYFSFLIIFVLPLDVSSTVYRQCLNNLNVTLKESSVCEMPLLFVPGNLLPNLWRVVYWTSQFLTWLVLPLMQSYAKAGEFTAKGRLKSALVDNAIYYGSYLFICGVLLVYIALKPGLQLDGQKLKAIASSASNTWGLLLLVGLLGYALVDIPRSLWLSSKPGYRLQRAYFKAAKISADKCEAEETLEDVLESIQWMKCCVTGGDPLYQEMKTVLDKVPRSRSLTKRNPAQSTSPHADSMISPSLRSLVRIHQLLIKSLHTCKRTETQWKLAVRQVVLLEDIERNRHSRDRTFKHTFPGTKPLLSPTFEWYWRCLVVDYLYQLLGLTYALFSAAVLWSELTFFNASPVLSIFAIIINFSKEHYDYFTIDIFSTVIIGYLCYCAYSTVFKIRVLNYYYLAPHHQTDEQSLIFAGMMLCRLTPPMCLNFLGLIHMDSHIIKQQLMETYYTQVMGHMEVVSIISDGFNVYFPMAVLAFCLATYFSLGSRLLSFIGFHQFLNDHELTGELIDEGRELINREKRRRQRSEETAERRRDYNERFGIGKQESSRSVSSPPEGAVINSGVMRDSSSRSNLLTSSEPVADYQTDYRHQPPRGLFDDI